ncbi:MAG: ABC transporter substrate-binding protein [Pseudomonadota bacterium]
MSVYRKLLSGYLPGRKFGGLSPVAMATIALMAANDAQSADRIGLSVPLSGRYAQIGSSMEFGAHAAVKALNEQGRDITLTIVDDACDAEKVPDLITELTQRNVEIVVGLPCFAVAQALARQMKSAEKDNPIVASQTRNALLERLRTVEGLPIYELSHGPDAEARAVVDLLLPLFEGRPFAIVDDGSVYGRSLAEAIRLIGEAQGARAVTTANFRPLQSTQRGMVRRLQRSGVEAVFVAAAPEDVVTIMRDIRALRLDWIVATGEQAELLPFIPEVDETTAGLLSVRATPLPEVDIEPDKTESDAIEDRKTELTLGHALVELAAAYDPSNPETPFPSEIDTLIGTLSFNGTGRAEPSPFEPVRWVNGEFESLGPTP